MCEQAKNFDEKFMRFITNRVCEVLDNYLALNEEYRRLNTEIGMCQEEIKALAPVEGTKEFEERFNRFDSLNGELEGVVADIIYQQGLKDGMRLGCIFTTDQGGA